MAVGGEPQAIVELHAEDKKDAAHRHAVKQAAAHGARLALGRDHLDLVRYDIRVRVRVRFWVRANPIPNPNPNPLHTLVGHLPAASIAHWASHQKSITLGDMLSEARLKGE